MIQKQQGISVMYTFYCTSCHGHLSILNFALRGVGSKMIVRQDELHAII